MTHTPPTTQPAQTRRTTIISRWLIAACAAAILPTTAQASHEVNRHVLLPTVDKLHGDVATFEQLASQRWFPAHEFEYIRLMTKQACRLSDAVKCNEHYWRIRGDYEVLRGFVLTVDARLCRHRAAQFDHQLMQLWNAIKHDFEGAGCLVRNECSAKCGHLAPPLAVPPHRLHGTSVWTPRGPGIPPTAAPQTRDFRTPDGRVQDARPSHGRLSSATHGSQPDLQFGRIPSPERPSDARYAPRGNSQRQPNATLAWFERLSAALAR